ncbi:hypothetical protein GMRT_16112 [Giardia muris]|uniref:Uncharacterized protein n=1 Tax=Giardia muris TaxID=5742 RepID=A0A4Z1T087_GIAMU|nr:hypothetical protein GMRT_16112 [Giardia muris]|eukprot:TNJ30395.1 hypothetical protein GMRT_16112 [Giardia muris]
MVEYLTLRVYFDEAYFFISKCTTSTTVGDYCRQLELEYSVLFGENVTLFGLQNAQHCDLLPTDAVGDVLQANEAIFPIRSILTCTTNRLNIQLLAIPQLSQFDALQPKEHQYKHHNPNRCKPYCQPLAPFGKCNDVCPSCGEVKAYLATTDNFCTPFCYSSEIRKQKSQGQDFCSICLGRLRQGKYIPNCMHQCVVCHRPWLILNRAGVCRTCHCVITGSSSKLGSKKDRARLERNRGDRRDEKASFKPDPIVVVGEAAIDPFTVQAVRESRQLGIEIAREGCTRGYGEMNKVLERGF